jgi:hypothetical protein
MSSVFDKFLKSLFLTLCAETTAKERSVFMSNPSDNPGQLDRELKKTSSYISLSDTDRPQALGLTHPINRQGCQIENSKIRIFFLEIRKPSEFFLEIHKLIGKGNF